jgi:SAM-dependent methyltransferase
MTVEVREMYDEGYWERGEGSNYFAYGDDPGWPVTAAVCRRVLERHATVLEVGCAKGYFVKSARAFGLETWGVDVSKYAIEHAHPAAVPYVAEFDGHDLPYADESFDAVVSWEVLEHIEKVDLPHVITEMHRVLKPGGLLINRIGMIVNGDEGNLREDVTHVTIRDRDWWLELFKQPPNLRRQPGVEALFDQMFQDRDWAGRFVAHRVLG